MTKCTETAWEASEAGKGPEKGAHQRSGVRLWAGSGPRKRGVAGQRNGGRVDRQLQVPEDFSDDTALGNHGDDPQRALLTHGAACHVYGKHMP